MLLAPRLRVKIHQSVISCACVIDEYLKSITDDLVITCDEIIHTSETALINFNDKRTTLKMGNY